MAKKVNINKYDLKKVHIEDLEKCVEPWSLAALLSMEPYSSDVDIMMENMLAFYEEKEMYDYCIVIRDEINSRK